MSERRALVRHAMLFLAGLAVADPDYTYNPETGGYTVSFPDEHWLPIIPSFGVSWEF